MSRRPKSRLNNTGSPRSCFQGARRAGLAWLLLSLIAASAALAQHEVPPPPAASDDSVRIAIEERIRDLNALRDSLSREADWLRSLDNDEDAELVEELGREAGEILAEINRDSTLTFDFDDLGDAIANIGRNIQDLKFELDDSSIQLTGPDGQGLQIEIPEDLGERISAGLSSITATILADLPDTLDFENKLRELQELRHEGHDVDWEELFRSEREPEYKVVGDGVITFGNDVSIASDEIVQGNVVAIFGDVEVAGRVEGDVISIGGYIGLVDDAYVEGDVLAILGDLERDDSVSISGSVGSFDFSRFGGSTGFRSLVFHGAAGFISHVTMLVALSLMILLAFAVIPKKRLERISGTLRNRPRQSLGAGLLWAVGGHIALAILLGLLIITVIGIPLALLLLLGYLLMGLVAFGAVSQVVGEYLASRRTGIGPADWVKILIGILVISLPTLIGLVFSGLPLFGFLGKLLIFAGVIIHLLAYCFGSGTILLSRFGSSRTNPL